MDAKKELNEYVRLINIPQNRYKKEFLSIIYGAIMTIPLLSSVLSILFLTPLYSDNIYNVVKVVLVLAFTAIVFYFRKKIEKLIVRDELSKKYQLIKNNGIYKGQLSEIFNMSCTLTVHVLKMKKQSLEIEISKQDGIKYEEILKIIDEIEYLKEIVNNDKKIRAIQDLKDIQDRKIIKSELITKKEEREKIVVDTLCRTDNKALSLQRFYLLMFGMLLSLMSVTTAFYVTSLLFSGVVFENFVAFLSVSFFILIAISVIPISIYMNKRIYVPQTDYSDSLYHLFDMRDEVVMNELLRATTDQRMLDYYLLDGRYEKSKIEILKKDIRSKKVQKKDLDILNEKLKNKTGMIAELENLK